MNDTTQKQIDRLKSLLPEYTYYQYGNLLGYNAGLFQKRVIIDGKTAYFITIDVNNMHLEFRRADDFVSFETVSRLYPKNKSSYEHQVHFQFNMLDSDNEIIAGLKELEEHCLVLFNTNLFKHYEDR